jgi:hypothetical protein
VAWGEALERVVLLAAGIGLKHVYDKLIRQRRVQSTLALELSAPVPQMPEEPISSTVFASDAVMLNVRNVSSKPVELFWAGIAWKSAPKGSGLPVDEGSVDLRHASPGFPNMDLLPGKSVEFQVTTLLRLNANLAWVGVEVILADGEHQTFKVPHRQLGRLIQGYERYQQRAMALLNGRR